MIIKAFLEEADGVKGRVGASSDVKKEPKWRNNVKVRHNLSSRRALAWKRVGGGPACKAGKKHAYNPVDAISSQHQMSC